MVLFSSSVCDSKQPFRANLVQKIETVSLTWNFVLRLIQICRIQWCLLFCLPLQIPFLVKCGPKNQNFQFKQKFGAKNNLNMQNSMVVFGQIWPKKSKSLGSLLTEMQSQWFFLFQSKDETSHTNNIHFGFPGYQPWFVIVKFSFKLYFVNKVNV